MPKGKADIVYLPARGMVCCGLVTAAVYAPLLGCVGPTSRTALFAGLHDDLSQGSDLN